ncbi:tenascin-like isoform X1 [Dermacentor albipictus]|uniref:tenascin-like isoform X1 n=1 Tax=Dermacentor albipictus TaxID=60249 RepID=UPI0038FC4D95
MAGPLADREVTCTSASRHEFERLIWRLTVVAVLASQGSEGFEIRDFDKYDVLNATVLHATVRLLMSDESRFFVQVVLSKEELGGEVRFEYLDTIKGQSILPLVLRKKPDFSLASSRMDLGAGSINLRVTYTRPNGTVAANGTLILTPYTEKADIPCTSNWDCRKYKSNCIRPPLGRCRCPRGSKFEKHRGLCQTKCTDKNDCIDYLGPTSLCFLNRCTCTSGSYLLFGQCNFPTECTAKSCSGGAICENWRCLCPTGFLGVQGSCIPLQCKNDSDCGLWLHMECARARPGSRDKFCRCANGTALLQGSCNPTTNLGPCPYGLCKTEYSTCDPSTSTCFCKKGYELRIYSSDWVCEKKETQTVDRVCMDDSQCYKREICEDNLCRCPKGMDLKNLECVEIKLPKVRTNLTLFLWLSVAMLALIVMFLSFGCCLYLLAQRAENEQNAIAQMFDVSEDFSIKGTA